MRQPTRPPHLIFDFPGPGGESRRETFLEPGDVIVARGVEEVVPALGRAEAAARGGRFVAGFVAYEAAPAFDPLLKVRAGATPLVWFGVFDAPAPLEAGPAAHDCRFVPPAAGEGEEAAFGLAVERIREAIARGDVYQVNHTVRLRGSLNGDALAVYERLRAAQGSGYCAYLDIGEFRVLSASPELFFERTGNEVATRPMKGTAARGRWLEEDHRRAAELAASEKDRAENLMIVDLLRNDLGRVASFGTVRVPRMLEVERYRTVHQMTSTIEASLPDGTGLAELFAALFPCGSVTGAPKIAAMRFITELEEAPRGVYCGAVGLLRPGGDCTFNVAIRTLVVEAESGRAEYGAGGGITWDSRPREEYHEMLSKAALLSAEVPDFQLLETFRIEDGIPVRLDRHLARMRDSAEYFGFPFAAPEDFRGASALVAEHAAGRLPGPRRARLLLSAEGALRIESDALRAAALDHRPEPSRAQPPEPVGLALEPVSRDDPFLFHKTTHRSTYRARRADHPALFDVLLWNREEELTELTIGNLVLEIDGTLWTPQRECGLLAGVFRAELLESGQVRERVVRRDELARATRLWLISSLRGWVPIRLVR